MTQRHHAFVVEAAADEGIEIAREWAERELRMKAKANPDVVVLRYGLLSVADARRAAEFAASAPFSGEHKVVVIAVSRIYHEAQNALLKLFEEPPKGVHLFLAVPNIGSLLLTLRSRVQVLGNKKERRKQKGMIYHTSGAEEFLKASKEKRSAIIKKLTSGKDEEERRANRDEALALVNGIEAVAYQKYGLTKPIISELLSEIQVLHPYLHDRAAPVKMILEHLSLVIPQGLLH